MKAEKDTILVQKSLGQKFRKIIRFFAIDFTAQIQQYFLAFHQPHIHQAA